MKSINLDSRMRQKLIDIDKNGSMEHWILPLFLRKIKCNALETESTRQLQAALYFQSPVNRLLPGEMCQVATCHRAKVDSMLALYWQEKMIVICPLQPNDYNLELLSAYKFTNSGTVCKRETSNWRHKSEYVRQRWQTNRTTQYSPPCIKFN